MQTVGSFYGESNELPSVRILQLELYFSQGYHIFFLLLASHFS